MITQRPVLPSLGQNLVPSSNSCSAWLWFSSSLSASFELGVWISGLGCEPRPDTSGCCICPVFRRTPVFVDFSDMFQVLLALSRSFSEAFRLLFAFSDLFHQNQSVACASQSFTKSSPALVFSLSGQSPETVRRGHGQRCTLFNDSVF